MAISGEPRAEDGWKGVQEAVAQRGTNASWQCSCRPWKMLGIEWASHGGDGYNNGYDHKSPILHGLMMAWWGWFLTGLWMIMGITTQSPKYTPCCFLAMEGVSKTSATNYMFNRLWKKLFSKRKAADWRFLTGAEFYRHLTKVPRNEDRCHGQLWVALGANCLQINQDMTTGEEPTLQASGNLTMKIGTTSN